SEDPPETDDVCWSLRSHSADDTVREKKGLGEMAILRWGDEARLVGILAWPRARSIVPFKSADKSGMEGLEFAVASSDNLLSVRDGQRAGVHRAKLVDSVSKRNHLVRCAPSFLLRAEGSGPGTPCPAGREDLPGGANSRGRRSPLGCRS